MWVRLGYNALANYTIKIMPNPDPAIFRAYDIRGNVGKTLMVEDAFYIGKAYASYIARKDDIENPRVAVAYDGRLSSPELFEQLTNGIISAGGQVLNLGRGPTPLLYYGVFSRDLDGGVMITGSHNPPAHNGFKMTRGKAALFGHEIQELLRMICSGDMDDGEGSMEAIDVMDEYVAKLMEASRSGRKLKVAWDAGNGAAGEVMQQLCAKLTGEHVMINEVIDGNFPAHHPDPTVPENMQQLIALVKKEGCDLGIAFDGDGDRIGVVDDNGEILTGDQQLMLYARDVLSGEPGATIVADVKTSEVFFDDVKAHGGEPVMWKTGHSYIKDMMRQKEAKFGGESSGHIFFADRYYGFDDALYAAVRLLNIVAADDRSLANVVGDLPTMYATPELRVRCEDDQKFAVIEDIKAKLEAENIRYSDVDGIRVMTDGGWWLLRASNTQPALTVRCEGSDDASLARVKAQMEAMIAPLLG